MLFVQIIICSKVYEVRKGGKEGGRKIGRAERKTKEDRKAREDLNGAGVNEAKEGIEGGKMDEKDGSDGSGGCREGVTRMTKERKKWQGKQKEKRKKGS